MNTDMSLIDHTAAFKDAMTKEGIVCLEAIVADGKLHRFDVEGDPKGKRNGFYVLHGDERPAGIFGCNRRYGNDHKFHWTGKGTVRLTPEERAELAKKSADARARRAAEVAKLEAAAKDRAVAMWDRAKPATQHAYLTRKGVKAEGLRVGDWMKERKDGTEYVAARGALLIPIRDLSGMVSLQAIFEKPIGDDRRDKDFVHSGKKRGCWSTIGKPGEFNGRQTVLICEGYATGATLHEATGLAVLVAFDAGNLIHVARKAGEVMPDARIVICGDNDQFTEKPIKNPGLTRARAAAEAVGCEWIVPAFDDLNGEPTDFNDLHAIAGLGAVRNQVMGLLDPQREVGPAPAPEDEPPPWDGPDEFEPAENVASQTGVGEDDAWENPHFTILGHDDGAIYFYHHAMRMIVRRGFTDWSESALTMIAPLEWWEVEFPGSSGVNRKMAVSRLQRAAFKRGFFDPANCRGRGAWRDDGRFVFHFGNRLWIDGEMMEVTKIDSTYVYEQGKRLRLPADEPLTNKEGARLVETAQGFLWTRPASALLLAGWMALAPVGGALRWRPHIWITGGAGSGKSTILDKYLHPLMNGICVYAQGNSTEAGIRQTLRTDALPVLFDESEQNNDREVSRIQGVLAMARQSSTESGAKTLKGTQGGSAMDFMIRSMFCLSSIQVGMKHQADMERISVLALKPKREGRTQAEKDIADEKWASVQDSLAWIREPDVPARLLRRSLELLPTTILNIETFATAAARKFGTQREGDQYGALLAGAWSLVSTRLATMDDARKMIDRYDWSDYLEGSEVEESEKALYALLGGKVRPDRGAELTVYELIEIVAAPRSETGAMPAKDAHHLLRRHGIRVETNDLGGREVWVANSDRGLGALMRDTPYAADLKGHLVRLPGAEKSGEVKKRFAAGSVKFTRVPIDLVLDADEAPAVLEVVEQF